jgi:uncharacterized protein (TIRG00374 family)
MTLNRGKMIRYVVFGLMGVFVAVILLTTIFSGVTDVKDQWSNIKLIIGKMNWWWVAAAALTNVGTFFLESFQLWFLARTLGKKPSYWRMWEIYFVGNFFSNATPSTSGGEPFQVYFLQDDGFKVAESTVMITIRGIISVAVRLLFVFIILLAVPFGFRLPTNVVMSWITYISLSGFVVMAGIGVFIIANPFIFIWLVNLLSKWKWLLKISKIKDVDEFKHKGLTFLSEIRHAGKLMLGGNKLALAMAVVNSAATWFLLKIMPYFVLLALGASPNILAVMAIGVMAQFATAWFPTPGAVGATEAGIAAFFIGFITIFPTQAETGAAVGIFTLVYRLMDYHMDVLFGAPIALTMLAKKLGKSAGTADLGALSEQISEKMEVEQEKITQDEVEKLEKIK